MNKEMESLSQEGGGGGGEKAEEKGEKEDMKN